MTQCAQTVRNIAVYGSAMQLAFKFMVHPINPTQLWSLTVTGAFSIVTAKLQEILHV